MFDRINVAKCLKDAPDIFNSREPLKEDCTLLNKDYLKENDYTGRLDYLSHNVNELSNIKINPDNVYTCELFNGDLDLDNWLVEKEGRLLNLDLWLKSKHLAFGMKILEDFSSTP